MSNITVQSSTQRLVISTSRSVSVINAGPPGPPGASGGGGTSNDVIGGDINVASTIWIMTHGLNMAGASKLNPSVWYFEDENGNPMEPISVDYVNPNIASAGWLTPVRGSWRLTS